MTNSFDRKKLKFTVTPVENMILVLEDDQKTKTSGGILLPETCKINVLTGMIINISDKIKNNPHDYPFYELDRIIYDVRHAIPIDLEYGNKYFLIDCKYIYGIITKNNESEK